MIKINKSRKPGDISCDADYRKGVVYETLKRDCHEKCYICEDGTLTSIQVEHMDTNRELRHEWENLMFSCGHCNGIKNAYYVPIINCCREDPEDIFVFQTEAFPWSEPSIKRKDPTSSNIAYENTEKLLNHVYNGTPSAIRNDECESLRDRLFDELRALQNDMVAYREKHTTEERREELLSRIKWRISRQSPFSAFKREKIRSDPGLFRKFGGYLD